MKPFCVFVQAKKKKDRNQQKELVSATDTAYGTLNVKVSGYDMTVVEHYSQYIHNLCNRLNIKVAERWRSAGERCGAATVSVRSSYRSSRIWKPSQKT